jgi:hypothetical protein
MKHECKPVRLHSEHTTVALKPGDPFKQRSLPVVFYNVEGQEGAAQLYLGQFVKKSAKVK